MKIEDMTVGSVLRYSRPDNDGGVAVYLVSSAGPGKTGTLDENHILVFGMPPTGGR